MTKQFQLIVGTVFVGCLVFSGVRSVFCQQSDEARRSVTGDEAKPQTQAQTPGAPTEPLRGSMMIGSNVNFHSGSSLGKVADFVINDGGCVQYVVVSYQNRFVPVPWMATTFNPADRTLILGIEEDQLAQIPTFAQFGELSNAQFAQKVHTFFKVQPNTSERSINKPIPDDKAGANKAEPQTNSQDQKPAVGTNASSANKPEVIKQRASAGEKQSTPHKTNG